MRKILFASMLAAGLVLPALAEDAGTIKLHSGWKLIQERVDKGVAYGTLWGVTFNDAGSGPLHMAPVSGTYSLTQETGKGEGELTGAKVMTNSRGRLASRLLPQWELGE